MKQETKQTPTPSPSIHEEGKLNEINLPKLLAIGLETGLGDDAQIIMETGEHIATIERSPSLEIAQEIIKRYNAYETLLKAMEDLSKEVSITGLKLGVKKHFSLLVAKAYVDKLIHQFKNNNNENRNNN